MFHYFALFLNKEKTSYCIIQHITEFYLNLLFYK